MKKFEMPEWMKEYEELISNTGGNDVEELLNREFLPGTNDVVAAMQVSVASQVKLLQRLKEAGLLGGANAAAGG